MRDYARLRRAMRSIYRPGVAGIARKRHSVEEPLAFSADEEGATVDQSGAHQRAEPRDSMFLNSTIQRLATAETWPLRVRNLSSGGLMADCPGTFTLGDEVEMDVRGVGLQKGTIAWTANHRIGVTFERPINPMLARRPVGRSRVTTDAGLPRRNLRRS